MIKLFGLHLRCRVIVQRQAVVNFEALAAADDLVEQPRAYRRNVKARRDILDTEFG
ncbi:hypothetical protein D3C76_1560680 [compost metagenome]